MATYVFREAGRALGALIGGALAGPVGAKIGGQVGGAIGAIYGTQIDQQIFGGKPRSPRNDARVSGASAGIEIPILISGQSRFTGHIVVNKKPQTKTSSGKGKPSTTKVFSTHACVCCESPTGAITVNKIFLERPAKTLWTNGSSANKVEPEFVWDGTQTTPEALITAIHDPSPAYTKLAGWGWNKLNVTRVGGTAPDQSALCSVTTLTVEQSLQKAFNGLCGIDLADLDFSALSGKTDKGSKIEGAQVVDYGAALADFHNADLFEWDGKLQARLRESTSDYSLEWDELGVSEEGEKIRWVWTLQQDQELPNQLTVFFTNIDKNCQQDSVVITVDDGRPLKKASLDYTFITCTESEAEAFGRRSMDHVHQKKLTCRFSLLPKRQRAKPADRVTLPTNGDGDTVLVKLTRVKRNPLGGVECEAIVIGQAGVQSSSASGGGGGGSVSDEVVPATAVLSSGIEPFRTSENVSRPGIRVGATSLDGSNNTGFEVFAKKPASSDWVKLGDLPDKCNIGTAETALGSAGAVAGALDATNNFDQQLDDDGELAAASQDELENAINLAILEDELIAVSSWSVLSGTRRYNGSSIVRGLDGTSMTGHAIGDRFMEIAGSKRFDVPEDWAGLTVTVRVVAEGQAVTDVSGVWEGTVTVAGVQPVDAVAPQSIQTVVDYEGSSEVLIAYPIHVSQTPPPPGATWQWQYSADGGATWVGGIPNAADQYYLGPQSPPISMTTGQRQIRGRMVAQNGTVGGWVYGVNVTYSAPPSSEHLFVDQEAPTGAIDGANAAYTLAQTPVSGSLHLYYNGQLLRGGGVDYTLSDTTITMTFAPVSGDWLAVSYRYVG